MSEIDIRAFDPADDALRAQNAQTVQAFLALTGAELPRRMCLFCEEDDISYGEAFTKTGQPDIATGRAAVQQRLQQLANSYPALTWQGGKYWSPPTRTTSWPIPTAPVRPITPMWAAINTAVILSTRSKCRMARSATTCNIKIRRAS